MTSQQTIEPPINSMRTCTGMLWTGRIISGLVTAFFLLDAGMKLFPSKPVIDGTVGLGYNKSVIIPLGVVLLCCTILSVIPRTAVLGGLLLTAYLGGAVASNVRAQTPVFNCAFPIIICTLLWIGMLLRDSRLRDLLPIRR